MQSNISTSATATVIVRHVDLNTSKSMIILARNDYTIPPVDMRIWAVYPFHYLRIRCLEPRIMFIQVTLT